MWRMFSVRGGGLVSRFVRLLVRASVPSLVLGAGREAVAALVCAPLLMRDTPLAPEPWFRLHSLAHVCTRSR